MSRFDRLSALCDEISDLQKRVRQAAQEEFKPALKEVVTVLREEVPQVEMVRWQQWIPGFNDGEPCEFSMGDTMFKFDSAELEDAGDYENGFLEGSLDKNKINNPKEGDYVYGLTLAVQKEVITVEQAELLSELADVISGLDDAAELAFGPDVQVTINIDSGEIELENYDCGY